MKIKVAMRDPHLDGIFFTPEAVAGMVGQSPTLTVTGDYSDMKRNLGRVKVIEASLDDQQRVHLTIEVPENHERRVKEELQGMEFPDGAPMPVSAGFAAKRSIHEATKRPVTVNVANLLHLWPQRDVRPAVPVLDTERDT